MKTDSPFIASFLAYLQFEKRYSPHTVTAYAADLYTFFTYLKTMEAGNQPGDISAVMIRSWLAALKSEGLSSRSVNRKIAALRSFFKYQLRQGVVDADPMTQISAPKAGKRLPVFVERKGTDRLFHQLEFPATFTGTLHRLLLEILYHTGIRLSELTGLKTGNVDFSGHTIKVLGKGGKERIIPVSGELCGHIRTYLEQKSALPEADTQYLLVNEKGKKLYPKYVYRVVREQLGYVTTLEKRSPHVMRHTFATHLTNNGADLNAVKELLGHASLAATQVYTHNTIEQLRKVYEQAHPKSGKR
ncbi:tyrosine-type recombinase/integrase [Compostibacter hankyongensis]|uniref:tyrosine-type recombinase/integrase n=1 Tax=Compostibacter hankyongensis TaxID=1007089 RepID=UPI0031E6B75B